MPYDQDELNGRRNKNDPMNGVQWVKCRVREKTGKHQEKNKQQHNLQFLPMSNSHMGQGHMDVYKYSHPSLEATELSLLHNTANTTA
jgi:hypothetical protein